MPRRSLTLQTLHYLARPHRGRPAQDVTGPAAWTAKTVGDYEVRLDDDARQALLQGRVDALPTAAWREELARGRGFLLVRGLPEMTLDAYEAFFWKLGGALGVPGAQNDAGDLLGHVKDEGFDHQRDVRAYRTRTRINFHCDAADVVGLLCVSQGASGGGSRLVSSVTLHNEVLRQRPDLAPLLFQPFCLDTKSEGGLRWFPVPPCRFDGGPTAERGLSTFWHADYFRSVERHPDAPRLSEPQTELLELMDRLAEEHCIEMHLQPGDIQLVNNHTILHGRGAFSDGDSQRHLLRLWLSLEERSAPLEWLQTAARVAWHRLQQ
jgi:hypothetical protein